MTALHYMMAAQKTAKAYAGDVVAQMIREGASGETMRGHEIPQSVYYWVLGSFAWMEMDAKTAAARCLHQYRNDYLYADTKPS